MIVELSSIIPEFLGDTRFTWERIDTGHINSTFLIRTGDSQYILQRVNTYVFSEPEKIDNNMSIIGEFLQNDDQYPLQSLIPIKSLKGESLVIYDENYYRLLPYINNSVSYNLPNDRGMVNRASWSFAQFHKSLFSLNTDLIKTTIPDFFNFQSRIINLESSIIHGNKLKIQDNLSFIEEIRSFYPKINSIIALVDSCPKRILHGDPKLNNLLFDQSTFRPKCIVDLDTVMTGPIIYDISDMVRSYTSTVPEDHPNISEVTVSEEYLEQLLITYLDELGAHLTSNEIVAISKGYGLVTFIQSVRFLEDYLMDDRYYSSSYDMHNLMRAKNQFAFFKELSKKSEQVRSYLPK